MPDERPTPGPPTIRVEGELEVLRDLLRIERERLTVALRIEAERKIVFPETTVIARDVERLLEKVVKREQAKVPSILQDNRGQCAIREGNKRQSAWRPPQEPRFNGHS